MANHLLLRIELEEREIHLSSARMWLYHIRESDPTDQELQLECDRQESDILGELEGIKRLRVEIASRN